MKIHTKKWHGNEESLFYFTGKEIASAGNYFLTVCGDISLSFKEGRKVFTGDDAVRALRRRKFTDSDLLDLMDDCLIQSNNWFAIYKDNEGIIEEEALCDCYSDGIEKLQELE